MRLKPPHLVIAAFLFLLSCNNSTTAPKEEKTDFDKQRDLDSVSKVEAKQFSINSGAINGWADTNKYTYQLQNLLLGKLVSFNGHIEDILQNKNGSFTLKVGRDYHYKIDCAADIIIDSAMLNEFMHKFFSTKRHPECCFIFKVTNIQSMFPKLSAEGESNGDNNDDVSAYVTYDYTVKFIKLTGTLSSYYLYKMLRNEKTDF